MLSKKTYFTMNSSIISKINQYAKEHTPFLLIIDFDMQQPLLYTEEELEQEKIYFQTSIGSNTDKANNKPEKFSFIADPVPYTTYKTAFDNVQKHIKNGDTFLMNLTFPTSIKTDLSLETIFHISEAPYKLLYKDKFVVFSPETFVSIRNGKIYSNPMKGTIDASLAGARQLILQDEKETAEHNTIVDLIRNDLSMVSQKVSVNRYRYIDEIKTHARTLLQVSSEIEGNLPENYLSHLGDIMFKLLPAGSISGAPKEKTIEIIHDVEQDSRGYYTGIFAWFDGDDLDSAVMIRYIEKNNEQYTYRSGGGVTFQSDPEKEYRELIDKIYVPVIGKH